VDFSHCIVASFLIGVSYEKNPSFLS